MINKYQNNIEIKDTDIGKFAQIDANKKLVFGDVVLPSTTHASGILWNHDIIEDVDTNIILPDLVNDPGATVVLVKKGNIKVTVTPQGIDKIMGQSSSYITDSEADAYSVITLKGIEGHNDWLIMEGVGVWRPVTNETIPTAVVYANVQVAVDSDNVLAGGDLEYIKILAHQTNLLSYQCVGIASSIEKEYNISEFVGAGINPSTIRGIFIRCTGKSSDWCMQYARVSTTFPSNPEDVEIIYQFELDNHTGADNESTGSSQLVYVPINNNQESFKLKAELIKGNSLGHNWGVHTKIQWEIIGVQQIVSPFMQPEFDFFMAQGMASTANGYITHDTSMQGIQYGSGLTYTREIVNYVDTLGNTSDIITKNGGRLDTSKSWQHMFPTGDSDVNKPLYRPVGCTKTEIKMNYNAHDADVHNESGDCTIIVDWVTNTYSGVFNIRQGHQDTQNVIFPNLACDGIDRKYDYTSKNTHTNRGAIIFGSDVCTPTINITPNYIKKLPVFVANSTLGTGENAIVQVVVKHYKTVKKPFLLSDVEVINYRISDTPLIGGYAMSGEITALQDDSTLPLDLNPHELSQIDYNLVVNDATKVDTVNGTLIVDWVGRKVKQTSIRKGSGYTPIHHWYESTEVEDADGDVVILFSTTETPNIEELEGVVLNFGTREIIGFPAYTSTSGNPTDAYEVSVTIKKLA